MDSPSKAKSLYEMICNIEADYPTLVDVDLTDNEKALITIVANVANEGGQITIGEAGLKLKATKSAVSQLVSRLERKGLIKRSWSKKDRRRILLNLTAKGKTVLNEFHSRIIEFIGSKLEKFSEAESETFIRLFQKFLEKDNGGLEKNKGSLENDTLSKR